MTDTPSLELELKHLIIDTLELEDITAEDIVADEPLFVDGLGLDSIDALELGLALQKRYGITLDAEAEDTRAHFASLDALREMVEARRER